MVSRRRKGPKRKPKKSDWLRGIEESSEDFYRRMREESCNRVDLVEEHLKKLDAARKVLGEMRRCGLITEFSRLSDILAQLSGMKNAGEDQLEKMYEVLRALDLG